MQSFRGASLPRNRERHLIEPLLLCVCVTPTSPTFVFRLRTKNDLTGVAVSSPLSFARSEESAFRGAGVVAQHEDGTGVMYCLWRVLGLESAVAETRVPFPPT